MILKKFSIYTNPCTVPFSEHTDRGARAKYLRGQIREKMRQERGVGKERNGVGLQFQVGSKEGSQRMKGREKVAYLALFPFPCWYLQFCDSRSLDTLLLFCPLELSFCCLLWVLGALCLQHACHVSLLPENFQSSEN